MIILKTAKIILILLAVALLIGVSACGAETAPSGQPQPAAPAADTAAATDATDTAEAGAEDGAAASLEITDRAGNLIVLPQPINSILSMGPATTEILVELGFADYIVGIDAFSSNIHGLSAQIPHFDMMQPDAEQIIALNPDVFFMTGMTIVAGGADPFQIIRDAGIPIAFIPSPDSIAGIKGDISFIGEVLGAQDRADEIISSMEAEIAIYASIAERITERRTVYFELSPVPWMVSLGSDTFLHEMIELLGAVNVFADLESWTSISDEAVLEANPDVILTSVDFIENPVGEILDRAGWDAITAVRERNVFSIDTDSSNRPSHNIVIALREMAAAIYPEYFAT